MNGGEIVGERDNPIASFGNVATISIGPLPHLDDKAAVEFAFNRFDIPTMPSLPRSSPSESKILQALSGIHGVSFGQHGSVAVDALRLDPAAPVITDIGGGAFGGFAAAIDHMRSGSYRGPVKWQIVGPISMGVALVRAGAQPTIAFDVAFAAVRSHVEALGAAVVEAAPRAQQLIVIDEIFARDLCEPMFPLDPVDAIDRLSGVMAAAESIGIVGLRGGEQADVGMLIEAGPTVLFLCDIEVPDAVGRVAGFIERGGHVAWGAVRTRGPVVESAQRAQHRLGQTWRSVMNARCSLDQLIARSMLTTDGGLHTHDLAVASRIVDNLSSLARIFGEPDDAWSLICRQ